MNTFTATTNLTSLFFVLRLIIILLMKQNAEIKKSDSRFLFFLFL